MSNDSMPRPGWDRPERLRPGTAAWDSPPASYPSPSRHGRPSDSDLDTTQPRGSPSLRQKGGAQSPTKDRAGGGAKTKREIKKATKELEEVQRATLDLLQDIKRTKEEHRNMDKEADKLKKEVGFRRIQSKAHPVLNRCCKETTSTKIWQTHLVRLRP